MLTWGSSFVVTVHSCWPSQRSPAELDWVKSVELFELSLLSLLSVFDSCFLLLLPEYHLVPLLPLSLSFPICLSVFPIVVFLCTFLWQLSPKILRAQHTCYLVDSAEHSSLFSSKDQLTPCCPSSTCSKRPCCSWLV